MGAARDARNQPTNQCTNIINNEVRTVCSQNESEQTSERYALHEANVQTICGRVLYGDDVGMQTHILIHGCMNSIRLTRLVST